MGPEVDDIWTVRVFRDPETELKIFRIFATKNMTMGVVDVNEQIRHTPQGDIERVHWYAKSDLQFLDLLIRPVKENTSEEAPQKGSEKIAIPDRRPDPALGAEENPVTMMVYGKSGTGKTVFGASWPKPLLLIDIRERGTESITDVKGIDVAHVNEWPELDDLYWQLKDGSKYKSIVLDQLTAAQALGMSKLRTDKGMKPSEPFSQRGWGQLSGMMQELIYNYRELYSEGYNVLFNAHERLRDPQEEDDDRIAPSVGSNLMQSVASFANGAVSVIGNSFIREHYDKKEKTTEIQYCMRIGPHAYYAAKIRRPVSAGPVPGVLVNPTFDKIVKIQKGEVLTRKVKVRSK